MIAQVCLSVGDACWTRLLASARYANNIGMLMGYGVGLGRHCGQALRSLCLSAFLIQRFYSKFESWEGLCL